MVDLAIPGKDAVEGPVARAAKLDGPQFTSRSARGPASEAQAKPHLATHNLSWTSIAVLSFLTIACAALSSRLIAQCRKEEPNGTQAGAEVGRNGLFLFAQLAGLGLQLPNARHSAGHAAVPGFIRSGTVLYHARTDAGLPPSPEWLAWDVEMSFAIMASRPSENGTFLHTYALQRPLRVLYLDGQSAALSVELGGTQSAELLLRDVDSKPAYRPGLPYGTNRASKSLYGPYPKRPRGPPPRGLKSPLLARGSFEWLRSATARNTSPQPSLVLDAGFATTLYAPDYSSLDSARFNKDGRPRRMRNHRIWGEISQHDAEKWQRAVAKNVEAWHRTHEPRIFAWYRRPKVHLEADWSEKARGVQEHWGMRLESIARLLQDATMSLYQQHNASARAATPIAKASAAAQIFAEVTQVVEEINVLTYSLLAHALVGPTVPWPRSSASPDSDTTRAEWKTGLLERCAGERLTDNTSRTAREGPTSSLWNAAILSTQKVLCYMTIELFDETLSRRFAAARPEALDAQNTHDAGWLHRWEDRLDTLRSELEWSSWDTCPEACGADSFCYIPSWPLSMFMSAGPPPGPPPDDPGPGGPNPLREGASVGGCVPHRDGVESPEMHQKHMAQHRSGRDDGYFRARPPSEHVQATGSFASTHLEGE
ncbi:hypothetical protein CBOM_03962 [Ceraceosorus bombacis]|uniref:Uncharacterized protein n=1 Tax=Ceraceosorus bombacis TaxID=401625 RepID=A0A0P1BN02_9BASI|nr:hypothetical protein CBOM_03962 [Ceraceosorus bombacis]